MLPTLTESGHLEIQKKQEGKAKHGGGKVLVMQREGSRWKEAALGFAEWGG